MPDGYLLAATLLICLGLGAGAGRSSGRPDAGPAVGLWSGLAGALALFMTGAVATHVTAADAPAARATQVVGDTLAYLIAMLLALPVIGATLSGSGSMLTARR